MKEIIDIKGYLEKSTNPNEALGTVRDLLFPAEEQRQKFFQEGIDYDQTVLTWARSLQWEGFNSHDVLNNGAHDLLSEHLPQLALEMKESHFDVLRNQVLAFNLSGV